MTSAGLRIVELFRYGMVSLVALAVDLGLLELLHRFTTLHYLFSASLSFVAGGFVAYLLSVRFVFRHRRVDTAMTEGSIFIALGLVGLAINAMVLYWLVSLLALSLVLGKAIAACCTFTINYLLRRWALFMPRFAPQNP